MAGVGFELKKLFNKRESYLTTLKAYSISAIVTEGPMVLAILMLFLLRFCLIKFGATYHEQEIFLITITYTMIFSMLFSNVFLMFLSRYISDCIYQQKYKNILSAFYATSVILLVVGGTIAGIFILGLPIGWVYKVIALAQFCIMMIIWTQLTFLSAIKKYTKILVGFLVATIVGVVVAIILMLIQVNPLIAALSGSLLGYFIMFLFFMCLIEEYYPKRTLNLLVFFPALNQYKIYIFIGIFITLGLYGHNFVIWSGEYGITMLEKMRYSMMYDIPAFYACLGIIPMLVRFVVSVEVNFYKQYQKYFYAIRQGGRLKDIELARKEMVVVLMREIAYMFEIQLFITVFIAFFGGIALGLIGFDWNMIGIFRILSFGYCFYGLGRCVTIVMLYFDDRKGALMTTLLFAVTSIVFTLVSLERGIEYYGVGFLVAAVVTAVVALVRLYFFLKDLDYHIFCKQPIYSVEKRGLINKIAYQLSNLGRSCNK